MVMSIIRTKRLERGMTQEQAAAAIGVSRATWWQWEARGRIPLGRYHGPLLRLLGIKYQPVDVAAACVMRQSDAA